MMIFWSVDLHKACGNDGLNTPSKQEGNCLILAYGTGLLTLYLGRNANADGAAFFFMIH